MQMHCTDDRRPSKYLEAGFSKPNILGETGDDGALLWINLLNYCLKVVSLHTTGAY